MNLLREKRYVKKLRQQEVAEASGVTRAAYSNYETGKRTPSVKTVKQIAKVLEFDWTLFYEEQEA